MTGDIMPYNHVTCYSHIHYSKYKKIKIKYKSLKYTIIKVD